MMRDEGAADDPGILKKPCEHQQFNMAGKSMKHALTGTLQTRLRPYCTFVVAP